MVVLVTCAADEERLNGLTLADEFVVLLLAETGAEVAAAADMPLPEDVLLLVVGEELARGSAFLPLAKKNLC